MMKPMYHTTYFPPKKMASSGRIVYVPGVKLLMCSSSLYPHFYYFPCVLSNGVISSIVLARFFLGFQKLVSSTRFLSSFDVNFDIIKCVLLTENLKRELQNVFEKKIKKTYIID